MAGVQSAEGFTKRLTALAYSAVGKEPPAQEQAAGVPLVPIFVGIDTDHAGQQQQLRETFIYRLGDAKWGVKSATSRFLLETGQPGGHTEKNVEEMIKAGLKPYTNMQGVGKQQLVKLRFYVRHGDQAFRDEVLWDVGNPVYDAQTYAVRVCTALGLEADWFDAIRSHVQQQLDDVRQDLAEAPQDVELQQPAKKARRTDTAAANDGASSSSSKREGVPRIEPFDPAQDVEARRVAARQLKLQQRQKNQHAGAAAAAMQPQQQVSPQLRQLQQQQQQQQQQQGQQGAPQPQQQGQVRSPQGPGLQPPHLAQQPMQQQAQQQPMPPQQQVPGPALPPAAQAQQAAQQQLPAQLQALQQQQQQQQPQQTPQQQQQQQQMLQQLQQQQHMQGAHGHLHGQHGVQHQHMGQQAHVQQARLHHVPPGQVPGHLQAAHLLQQQPPQQHVPVGLPQQHLQQPPMPHQPR